jgi:hypothetical protein
MSSIPVEIIGKDETQPGLPFVRLFNPTEFDKAAEAMRVRIKQEHEWDLFNPTVWSLVGISGEPVKKFLTLYIKESNRLGKPYRQYELSQWENIFMNTYGYSKDKIHTYLRVLRQLRDEGAISDAIYEPYTYNPVDEDEPGEVITKTATKIAVGGVGIVVAGGITYLLLKEQFFGGRKR